MLPLRVKIDCCDLSRFSAQGVAAEGIELIVAAMEAQPKPKTTKKAKGKKVLCHFCCVIWLLNCHSI